MLEEELLARILCEVMGEDPDEMYYDEYEYELVTEKFGPFNLFTKSIRTVVRPTGIPKPKWKKYEDESRKYIAARSYFEKVKNTISKPVPVKKTRKRRGTLSETAKS